MSKPLQIQTTLPHPPERVFAALTGSEALASWFAEAAEVLLEEQRYDFWGRFTPGAPEREAGRHPLLSVEAGKRLAYAWRFQEADTQVLVSLRELPGGAQLRLQHDGARQAAEFGFYASEDFWFLSLENLRRWLDGRGVLRCDFSTDNHGDIRHTVEVDGPVETVYEALIRPEQLNRWIASNARVEPEVGGVYDLGWGFEDPIKIVDLAEGERLAYAWKEGDSETVVTWTLAGSGGKTWLTLVHSGFDPDRPTKDLFSGWLNFMSFLKSLAEYGADWRPPVLRLSPANQAFYAKAMAEGQGDLVDW